MNSKIPIVFLILALESGCFGQNPLKPKAKATAEKKQECKPPDPKDPYGEFNNNLSVNGVQYLCSKDGKWIVDEKVMQWKADELKHRRDLYWALRSRILTQAEMEEVKSYGISLVTEEWVPYKESEKQIELNAALLQQFQLRLAKER